MTSAAPATILIVDDEIRNRKLLVALLQPEGYVTVSAACGEEALALVAERAPDLILLDVLMPGMDGYQVASRLKADPATSSIPIIMVTARIERETRLAGLEAGAEDFLTKPVDRAELWLRVRNLLRLKAYGDFLQNHSAILEQQVQARAADLQLFRTALDATADGILLVNRTTMRIFEVNETTCQMLGYARAELLQLSPVRLSGGTLTLDQLEASYDEIIARRIGASTETRLRRKDGTWLDVEMHPHAHRSGPDWIMVGVFSDITERKRAADELRESDDRFRQLSGSIREVFWLTDVAKNHILYVSPGYEEIWGRSVQSVMEAPRTWLEAIHPDDRQEVLEAAVEQARGGYDREYRIVRPDGSIRWVHDRASPVTDESGAVFRIAGVAEDITERHLALEELRESERRFGDMLGNVEMASLMLDREARVTYCNDYLLRLSGWQREEVLGKSWFELFVPPPVDSMKKVFADLLENLPAAWHNENEILLRSGGRRLIRWNNSVLRSAAGEVIGVASLGEDITEQKEADRKIKVLNRVYAMLSGINTLIVRVRDRDELLREACRVAVEHGGFLTAWIGLVDPTGAQVEPVARDGDLRNFDPTPLTVHETRPGTRRLVGNAVATMKPVVVNDARNDPKIADRKSLARRGVNSLAVLPLFVGDKAIGALCLYSCDVGLFDSEEMKLLVELAGNISFALEHIEKTAQVSYLVLYDQLTGLANRTLFLERVEQKLRSAADSMSGAALFLVDVERFRTVNDALGRKGGDELLRQIAERLRKSGGDDARLARIGGDQFAVVSSAAQNEEGIARLIELRMKQCFGSSFRIGTEEVRVSAKAGVAVFPGDGADAETLLRNATAAVQKAKAQGEHYLFYTEEMSARIADTLALESKLRQALENDEFVLHYQPKVDLASGSITGVEALIRWQSRELGLVPPMEFIPLMEATGMILEAGAWALSRAMTDHARWTALGLAAPRVAVNVSAMQLRKKDFPDTIRKAIALGSNRTALDLEITESLIMEDIQGNIERLKDVQSLGVSIAIDDFGTGYSSLAYLAKLPLQTLKIDRSFIITMLDDPDTMTLVQTIISLAHSLRLKVVAEGVESEDQARTLRLLRCDEMQGYIFSKPLPFEALTALLNRAAGIEAHPAHSPA
jgi:diguanylate cyclase (GGDEF)-like protein/PAS domain S-box-containing protein